MDPDGGRIAAPEAIAAEISRLALDGLRASGSLFYWIDPARRMVDTALVGLPARFYSDYRDRMEAVDPSNIDRMTAGGHSVTQLRGPGRTMGDRAAAYCRLLDGYGIADVIDLMFWHEGVAVAGIGILKCRDDPATSVETLATAAAIQRFVEFTLTRDERVARFRRRSAMARHFLFTPRETEVAERVLEGLTNSEIAAALEMKLPTVKSHLLQILGKSGCATRTKLAAELHRLV